MKKYLFFTIILFLAITTKANAADNLMQCDYTLNFGEPSRYIKYRVILKDDGTITQSMPQNNETEYTEPDGTGKFYPTLYDSGNDKVVTSLPMTSSSFNASIMEDYYKNGSGSCPYLLLGISGGTSYNIMPVEDTTLNDGHSMFVVEGTTTFFDENEEPVEPNLPELTTTCSIHTEDGDINSIPGYTMEFQMYDNGDKYFKVYFTLRGEESAQTAKVGTNEVVVRPVDDYGKNYTIRIPAEEINNLFSQTSSQQASNTFTCLDANQIFLIEEAGIQEARYKISTNAEEAKEYDQSTSFTEGAGTLEVTNDLEFSTGDCRAYLGVVTDSSDPAYYLNFAFQLLKYAAIVILFVLTIVDFAKVIPSSKDDAIKKAINNAVKRLIIAVIIFFLPTLINFILDILGIISTDPMCGIE